MQIWDEADAVKMKETTAEPPQGQHPVTLMETASYHKQYGTQMQFSGHWSEAATATLQMSQLEASNHASTRDNHHANAEGKTSLACIMYWYWLTI